MTEIRSHTEYTGDIRCWKPKVPQRWLNTKRKGNFTDLMRRAYRTQEKGKKRLTESRIQNDLRANKLKGVTFNLQFAGHNRVLDLFFNQLMARFMGTQSGSQTMEMLYLALGTTNTPAPASGDTGLNSEVARFAPTSRYTNGTYTFVFSVELGPSLGILTGHTTVAAGTWTTTNFDVADASAISVNNRLLVQTSATGEYTFVNVTAKATNNLTTDVLPAAPVVGDTVRRVYAEGGLYMNPATSTLGTGTPANHKNFDLDKTAELFILDGVLVFQPVTQ